MPLKSPSEGEKGPSDLPKAPPDLRAAGCYLTTGSPELPKSPSERPKCLFTGVSPPWHRASRPSDGAFSPSLPTPATRNQEQETQSPRAEFAPGIPGVPRTVPGARCVLINHIACIAAAQVDSTSALPPAAWNADVLPGGVAAIAVTVRMKIEAWGVTVTGVLESQCRADGLATPYGLDEGLDKASLLLSHRCSKHPSCLSTLRSKHVCRPAATA